MAAVVLAAPTDSRSAEIDPESARIAPSLPLADLHFHAFRAFTPREAKETMDRNGVRWSGGGVLTWPNNIAGRRDVWENYSRALGDRFIAFAGQSELNQVYKLGGIEAMADADNPGIQNFLKEVEADFQAGRVKGIGTIFINNRSTDDRPAFRRKMPGNASSVRAIYKLVAEYGSVLRIHMEPDPDSLSQFEPVMASDRRAAVLWNQCGSTASAAQVRALMERNENLYCELSWRFPPITRAEFAERYIFDNQGPKADWLRLMEDLPERFMFGNDGHGHETYDAATQALRRHLLPYLKPATARGVAYENAKRVFSLK